MILPILFFMFGLFGVACSAIKNRPARLEEPPNIIPEETLYKINTELEYIESQQEKLKQLYTILENELKKAKTEKARYSVLSKMLTIETKLYKLEQRKEKLYSIIEPLE